ncbi:hypothetical protein CVT26_007707 [Gymnopilus dilepis]|uniref:Uncharacterized protein n=1 Tax=Gymnopilus dilepis TaxID=231916 RepID=A0A409WIK8_9AGAR|nr:hypothetical protein CVT26_007707 [Gymnopilus dilepis]
MQFLLGSAMGILPSFYSKNNVRVQHPYGVWIGVVVALAVVMFRSAASASRLVRPVRLAAVRKKQEGRGGYRTTRDAGVLSELGGAQHSSVHGGSTRKGGGIVGL